MYTLNAPVSSGQFELPKEELQRAVIVDVIDLGLKENTQFKTIDHQLALGFELIDDLMTIEKYKDHPFLIHKTVTVKLGPKATLRKVVEAVHGKPMSNQEAGQYNIFSLLGKPLMVQIYHKKKTDGTLRGDIASYSAIHKSMKDNIKPFNELKSLSLANFDEVEYNKLNSFLKGLVNLESVPEALRPKVNF